MHFCDKDGRYIVRFPLNDDEADLSGTRTAATRLLSCMENRFARNARLQALYRDFMREYEDLGHMSAIDAREPATAGRLCFLPYHGVLKDVDGKAKLRVVFNGSSTLPGGISLNSKLHIGQNLLPALPDILIRWSTQARHGDGHRKNVPADYGIFGGSRPSADCLAT